MLLMIPVLIFLKLINFSFNQLVDDTELESLTKMMKDLYDSEAKLVDILDSMEQEENRGVQVNVCCCLSGLVINNIL